MPSPSESPNNFSAQYGLGVDSMDLGLYKEAIKHFRLALKVQPRDFSANNSLGAAFMKLGLYQDAIKCFRLALEVQPNNLQVTINLGVAFMASGRHHDAIECFRRVIKVKPDDFSANNNLGLVFMRLGHYEDAIKHFYAALNVDPSDSSANNNLGSLLTIEGDFQKAIGYLEKGGPDSNAKVLLDIAKNDQLNALQKSEQVRKILEGISIPPASVGNGQSLPTTTPSENSSFLGLMVTALVVCLVAVGLHRFWRRKESDAATLRVPKLGKVTRPPPPVKGQQPDPLGQQHSASDGKKVQPPAIDEVAADMARSFYEKIRQELGAQKSPNVGRCETRPGAQNVEQYFEQWLSNKILENFTIPSLNERFTRVFALVEQCQKNEAPKDILKFYIAVVNEYNQELSSKRDEAGKQAATAARNQAVQALVEVTQQAIAKRIGMPEKSPGGNNKSYAVFRKNVLSRVAELTKSLAQEPIQSQLTDTDFKERVLEPLLNAKFSFDGKAETPLRTHISGSLPHHVWDALGLSKPGGLLPNDSTQTIPAPLTSTGPFEPAQSTTRTAPSSLPTAPAVTVEGEQQPARRRSLPPSPTTPRQAVMPPEATTEVNNEPPGVIFTRNDPGDPLRFSKPPPQKPLPPASEKIVFPKVNPLRLLERTRDRLAAALEQLHPEKQQDIVKWGANQLLAVNTLVLGMLQLSAISENFQGPNGGRSLSFVNHFKSSEFAFDLLSWALNPEAVLGEERTGALCEGTDALVTALKDNPKNPKAVLQSLSTKILTKPQQRKAVTTEGVGKLLTNLSAQFGASPQDEDRPLARTLTNGQLALVCLCVGQLAANGLLAESQTSDLAQNAVSRLRTYRNSCAHTPFGANGCPAPVRAAQVFLNHFKGQAPRVSQNQNALPQPGDFDHRLPTTTAQSIRLTGVPGQVQTAVEMLAARESGAGKGSNSQERNPAQRSRSR